MVSGRPAASTKRRRKAAEIRSGVMPGSARSCMTAARNHASPAGANTLGLAARSNSAENNPMNEELQQAVDAGKLTSAAAETLSLLEPGASCLHKSWGFGRVAEWSLLTGQIVVDFESKKGHLMQAQYAADTLQPIPSESHSRQEDCRTGSHQDAGPAGSRLAASRYPSGPRRKGNDRPDRSSSGSSDLRFRDLQEVVGWREKETQGGWPLPASRQDGRSPSCCSPHRRSPARG